MPMVPDFLLNRVDPRFLSTGGIDPRSVFNIPAPGQLFTPQQPEQPLFTDFNGGPSAGGLNTGATSGGQQGGAVAGSSGGGLGLSPAAISAISSIAPAVVGLAVNPIAGMALSQALSSMTPEMGVSNQAAIDLSQASTNVAAQQADENGGDTQSDAAAAQSNGGAAAGGDGGGSKVICTHLMRCGYIERNLYRFAHEGFMVPAHVRRGYHLWAIPLVSLMRRHAWLNPIAAPLCRAWSRHVAHKRFPKLYGPHWPGAIMHGIGWAVCSLIGRLLPEEEHARAV